MAYATIEDVAVRLGVPANSLNQEQTQAVLDDTSALIHAYTGVDFSAEYDPIPQDIVSVTCSRTIRVLNNPDGLRQETIGTYSYTMAADAAALLGDWTAMERSVLDSYGTVLGSRRSGEFWVGYREGA